MHRGIARIKGIGFILWHGKHMAIHVLLGFMWVWVLREYWQILNPQWLLLAAFGSIFPDVDHFLYFFTYGKNDPYTKTIRSILQKRQWRVLVKYIESGHKYNTNLQFHNIYTLAILMGLSVLSFLYDYSLGVVLFGAMVTHYMYDMVEDVLVLGYLNGNWERFGHDKKKIQAPSKPQ